jgi:homoserine dehydrogenase
MSSPLKVALVGFGTVGRSVAKLLRKNDSRLLCLTHICNREIERKKVDWVAPDVRWTDDFEEILRADVDVVVELIGGLEPAGEWVRRALRSGKSVVTANKQLIAECGTELLDLARQNGQRIEFGASVAGGIPVLAGLREGLAGDSIYKILGILNGTCNYILTRMDAQGVSFSTALQEAQEKGFAEADPRDDLEGFDARAKLVILARAGLASEVRTEQVLCRSIAAIEAVDFAYARELDCTIRQISLALKDPSNASRIFASVQPALLPNSSVMAHVQGSQNCITAVGEHAGETVFSGYGAGGDPTAVAVVSDLVSIARSTNLPAASSAEIDTPKEVSGEVTSPHYVRFTVKDRPGIVAAVAAAFAKHGINIDAVLQKTGYSHSRLPFVITLEPSSSAFVEKALDEIRRLDFHVQPPICLPILNS